VKIETTRFPESFKVVVSLWGCREPCILRMLPDTSQPKSPQKTRFSEVDSLRAISCGLVILSHMFGEFWMEGEGIIETLFGIPGIGRTGVIIFFGISGFVIPSSLKGGRREGIRTFALRRFWRLFPPFWVVFILSLCCFPSHYALYNWKHLIAEGFMLPSFGQVKGHELWTHFWTLEVELCFYIIVGGLFLLFGRIGGRVIFFSYLIVIGLSIPYFSVGGLLWNSLIPHLAVMFWGSSCREILRYDYFYCSFLGGRKIGRSVLIGLVTAPVVTLGTLLTYRGVVSDIDGAARLIELGGSLLVAIFVFLYWAVLRGSRQVSWLSIAGRWTYSTYLLHAIALFAAKELTHFFLGPTLPEWAVLPYTIVVIVFCFTLGAIAYRWIEQPSDRIGKWLTARGR